MSKKPSILEIVREHLRNQFIDHDSENKATEKTRAEYDLALKDLESKLAAHLTAKEIFTFLFNLDIALGSLICAYMDNAFEKGFSSGLRLTNELKEVGA